MYVLVYWCMYVCVYVCYVLGLILVVGGLIDDKMFKGYNLLLYHRPLSTCSKENNNTRYAGDLNKRK